MSVRRMNSLKCLSADWTISTWAQRNDPSQIFGVSNAFRQIGRYRQPRLESAWEIATSQKPFGLIDDIDCTTLGAIIQAYFRGGLDSTQRREGSGGAELLPLLGERSSGEWEIVFPSYLGCFPNNTPKGSPRLRCDAASASGGHSASPLPERGRPARLL